MFNWASFLTYIFITAITPGPNTISSMSNGSRYGFAKAFPFNLGIFVAFSFIMMLCALFSSLLFNLLPKIKLPMLIVGAIYILWLAYKTYTSDGELSSDKTTTASFQSGALLQFVNPKIYIYGITALSAYILPYYDSTPIILAFCILLAFVGFVCTLLWSAFGSVFKTLFSKHTKLVNTVMALLLVYCAVALFF